MKFIFWSSVLIDISALIAPFQVSTVPGIEQPGTVFLG